MSAWDKLYVSFMDSFRDMWNRVFEYLPTFFAALLVLILGLMLSNILSKIVRKIVELTHVDEVINRIEMREEVKGVGLRKDINVAAIAEWLVKWFFYIVTFVTVVDILNIEQLSVFLERFVLYLPNILAAILIMAVGLLAGAGLKTIIDRAMSGFAITKRMSYFLSGLAKWSVFIFALMAALVQLGVAADLVRILFTGVVLMLSVAGGLAFGLGGREHASRILDGIEKEVALGRKK